NDALVYVAESRGTDVLVRREIGRVRLAEGEEPPERQTPEPPPLDSDEPWAVTNWAMKSEPTDDARPPGPAERVRLGRERRFRLKRHGIAAAYSPAVGPDGRIAFVGLADDGRRDVFVLEPEGRNGRVRRLTDDAHAERTLTWHGDRVV